MITDKNFIEIKNRLICVEDIVWAETYREFGGDDRLHLYLRGAKDILVFSDASVKDLKSAIVGLCSNSNPDKEPTPQSIRDAQIDALQRVSDVLIVANTDKALGWIEKAITQLKNGGEL